MVSLVKPYLIGFLVGILIMISVNSTHNVIKIGIDKSTTITKETIPPIDELEIR